MQRLVNDGLAAFVENVLLFELCDNVDTIERKWMLLQIDISDSETY